jgi:hypothetical protein
MAWKKRWPIQGGTPAEVGYLQDLVDEFNRRRPEGCPPLEDAAVGESTWNGVARVRRAVQEVLPRFQDPASGRPYAAIGEPDEPPNGPMSLFSKLFGVGRRAWLNHPDGSEAEPPNWDPPQGAEPHAFYVNELHDVIDALVCRRA